MTESFDEEAREDVATLQRAAEDASWLVERGYPMAAVSDFVATHKRLDERQRALLSCDARLNASFRHHIAREMDPEDVRKRHLLVDVSSAVGTIIAATSNARLLESAAGVLLDPTWDRGASFRDDAAVTSAVARIAGVLDELRPKATTFYAKRSDVALLEAATGALGKRKWKHDIGATEDAVASLAGKAFVISTDPEVLDSCATWVNVVGLALADVKCRRLRLSR